MAQRLLGIKQLMIDGKVFAAKGTWTYSMGGTKRESVMGPDGRLHGYKITAIQAYVDGAITDDQTVSLKGLMALDDSTVTIDLQNGKTVKFGHAAYVGDGEASTEEGEIKVRFECDPNDAEEI